MEETQDVLDHWHGLLRATGGALARSKSYWWMLSYKWQKDRWRYKTPSDLPGQLLLHDDETGDKEPIKRLPVSKAEKALGIYWRPDGHMNDQRKHLRKAATEWATTFKTTRLSKEDAFYCLDTTIMKKLEYPLMVTTFTKQDTDYIMAPILQAALPSIQVQKNLPRTLVYAPIKYQGLGIKDLWTSQLIEHLHAIMRHSQRPTLTGTTIDSCMEDLVLELGSSTSFWDLDFTRWESIITKTWMSFTWKCLKETSLSFKGPLAKIPPQRHHDRFIMDDLIASGLYTAKQLCQINHVRMWKQVTRLSDICTADGLRVAIDTFRKTPPTTTSPYEWPKNRTPSEAYFTLWKTAITRLYLKEGTRHRELASPLGYWLHPTDDYWEWWYDLTASSLYRSHQSQWTRWDLCPVATHTFSSPTIVPHNAVPVGLHRASVRLSTNGLAHLQSHGPSDISPDVPQPTTLEAAIAALVAAEQWTITDIQHLDNGAYLAQCIQQGTCIAVTDASLKDCIGTAAFKFVGPDDQAPLKGVNIVPGPIKHGDSLRCELSGLIGIVVLAHILGEIHGIDTGRIEIACDNINSLRVFAPWYIPNPSHENFDLIKVLWNLLKSSPFSWTTTHVKGHMDKQTNRPLTRLERINCEMDALANRYRKLLVEANPFGRPSMFSMKHEGWTVWNGSTKISSPTKDNLYEAIYAPKIKDFWTKEHRIASNYTVPARVPSPSIDIIDWDATNALMKSLSAARRRWCMKHGSEQCGVGMTLAAWKKQGDDECPRCQQPEDSTHVLQCMACDSQDVWSTGIADLTEKMSSLNTPIDLQQALLSRLQQWRERAPLINDPTWSAAITNLISSQDSIGWKPFLEGLPSIAWRRYIALHLHTTASTTTASQWMKTIMKSVHHLAWSLWDHRNQVLHHIDRPRMKRGIALLHQQLLQELQLGPQDLPIEDQQHFQYSFLSLISKPIQFQKAWLLNVNAARERHERRLFEITQRRLDSVLVHWMRTGYLR